MLTIVPRYFVGAASEVETLKKALAEAQERAEKEKAAREKHEARVGEVQQELQDAMKKCESLERNIADQETELAKAHKMPGLKPRVLSRRFKRPRRSRRVRPLLCRANM